MPAAAQPVNAQSTALGVTIRRVIVEQVVPERGVAIVRDNQQFATEVPYRVQQGRGRMPRVGDYWYVDRSMGPWVFSAYIAKSDDDIGTFADGEKIRIGTLPSTSTAVIAARVVAGTPILATGVNGDTVSQYTLFANGRMEWGPGGSTNRDTFLYRSASGTLKTDGALTVGGAFSAASSSLTGALTVGGALTAASAHVTGNTTLDGTLTATGSIAANNGITLPQGKYAFRGGMASPTFQNGWGNYTATAGFQPVKFIEYPDGTGGLTGTAKAGTLTNFTVIFNLPTQMRPSAHHSFICPADGGAQTQIRIESGGDVLVQSPDAGITWVGLSGCRWPLASAY